MKKKIETVIFVASVLVIIFVAINIYGCGGDLYGTWKCTNPKAVPECPITQFTITKGTVACEMIRVKDGTAVTENGVWVDAGIDAEDGKGHILLYDEDNNMYHLRYCGNELTLSIDGTDLVYKK